MLEFDTIKLNGHEIQSGSTRVDWAEGLILQLPEDHDGRNSWLLNYGISEVANEIRNNDTVKRHEEGCSPRVLEWDDDTKSLKTSSAKVGGNPVSVCPYVDETGDELKSYLTISKSSPWDADESEMVEVKDNAEAHKLLRLLELHFGIPNKHKN